MVGAKLREHYDLQAKERRESTLKQNKNTDPENLPERDIERGDARDQAGKAVGVSGKSIDLSREFPRYTRGAKHQMRNCHRMTDSTKHPKRDFSTESRCMPSRDPLEKASCPRYANTPSNSNQFPNHSRKAG